MRPPFLSHPQPSHPRVRARAHTDLGGAPVQYREVQSYESARFLSYFPRFVSLHGGVGTGFHHVSDAPPPATRRLYAVGVGSAVREVPAAGASVREGGAFVLDLGARVWQLNTARAPGRAKFHAAEFVQSLADARQGECETTVYGA